MNGLIRVIFHCITQKTGVVGMRMGTTTGVRALYSNCILLNILKIYYKATFFKHISGVKVVKWLAVNQNKITKGLFEGQRVADLKKVFAICTKSPSQSLNLSRCLVYLSATFLFLFLNICWQLVTVLELISIFNSENTWLLNSGTKSSLTDPGKGLLHSNKQLFTRSYTMTLIVYDRKTSFYCIFKGFFVLHLESWFSRVINGKTYYWLCIGIKYIICILCLLSCYLL